MAEKKRAGTEPTKPAGGFSAEEKAAMRARVKEMKAQATKAQGERDVLASIADMPPSDRALAERIHALVKTHAPGLSARTWYGMPAYTRDEQVICFFRNASKFKTRYATFGFSDEAKLDEGNMWPTDFALKQLTSADEARIAALLKKALG